MAGRPTTTNSDLRAHAPNWRSAAAPSLDWRFLGTDPVHAILRRSTARPAHRAANENDAPCTWVDWSIRLVLTVILTCALCATGVAAIAVLYIVKSALGIDLFAGHSFLHDWLYVRQGASR